MPLDPISVTIVLENLICRDEGRDPGPHVDPYLWAVYFNGNGARLAIVEQGGRLRRSGEVVTTPTKGSHGNLGAKKVDAGDVVPIPPAIGRFETNLTAIPVPPSLATFLPDGFPGFAGVVFVVLEQDAMSQKTAEEWHAIFNTETKKVLNELLDRILANPLILLDENPEQRIAEILEQLLREMKDAVVEALKRSLNVGEKVLGFFTGGRAIDDICGASVFAAHQQALLATPNQRFQALLPTRDQEEQGIVNVKRAGRWEVNGRITARLLPPITRPAPAGVRPSPARRP
jgi:hypothetical protein